jgi:thymidylate kinase
MRKGLVISFSGIDGSGKTTQINALISKLEQTSQPWKHVYLRIGFTKRIKCLKQIFHITPSPPSPQNQQDNTQIKSTRTLFQSIYDLLSVCDLLLTFFSVRWYRFRDFVVICDRYYWDNHIIYLQKNPQGNIEEHVLWRLTQRLAGEPEAAFLLKISPEEAHKRAIRRIEDVSALETLKIRAALIEQYSTRAKWQIVKGDVPAEQISGEIWKTVRQLIQ